MEPYKGILATYEFSNITVGELKKILTNIPENYEVIWSNQFEGVNEGVGTVAVDDLSKSLYFASAGVDQNDMASLDGLRMEIFHRKWQDIAHRSDDSNLKAKAKEALREVEEIRHRRIAPEENPNPVQITEI